MIATYFKLACRSLISKKHNSFISVLGLGFGIATAMLVGAYIVNENSFDKFQKNYTRIYRIVNKTRNTAELDKEFINSFQDALSLIHISEPTRQAEISYAVFCLKKKKKKKQKKKKQKKKNNKQKKITQIKQKT